jgi:hypothetical protein
VPFRRRTTWFIVTAGLIVVLVVVGLLSGDPEKPTDRAALAPVTTPATATPTPTLTPTPDPAVAARAKAARLTGSGRYADAAAVLEAAGLRRAADRVARRGSQSLIRRARTALAAGRWTQARRIATDARDLYRSRSANAIVATAGARIAEARAAARLARDQRTCSAPEKATVRAGGGTPLGCVTFAADLAARRAAQAAAQATTAQCNPNYAGACLKPDSPDYDCEGGSGNGPDYTGTVRVVGVDEYGLDADGDGTGCDT